MPSVLQTSASPRPGRLFLWRVVGLQLAAPIALCLAGVLRLVADSPFVMPTIPFPVAGQQVAAATLTLGAGWMLVDDWPRIVRTTQSRVAGLAVMRWGATQAVCVGAGCLAVAGVPGYDAVPVASLMCSCAALASVVVRQSWWLPPLLIGYVVLKVNGFLDPHDPVAHDLALPLLVGGLSLAGYVLAAIRRAEPHRPRS
jgi:hypothetical protein